MRTIHTIKKHTIYALFISVFVVTACDNPMSTNDAETSLQPEFETPAANMNVNVGEEVSGEYVVIFKKGTRNIEQRIRQIERASNGKSGSVFQHAVTGFTITLPPQANSKALQAIQNNPHIESIEADRVVQASNTQTGVRWNLDRIDQKNPPLDGVYNYSSTGKGVTAYVVDSGINYDHADFGGRASYGFDIYGEGGLDCDGHGTHVAGTIGGTKWGVAKDVDLVAVRVLDCNGKSTVSRVIAGVDWITANADGPSVVNMSLVTSASTALDTAVKNSIESGITYIFAAGNSYSDACNYSPARLGEGLTVGATTSADARAAYSNDGTCVDLFAPGSSIRSTWIGNNTIERTLSGTSMAAPHVAGAAVLYLENNPEATPAQVQDFIRSATTKNIITNSESPNNHLLFIEAQVASNNTPRIVRRTSRW